jgi:hypothetical protein
MATEAKLVRDISFKSSGDLSAGQGKLVKLSAADTVALVAAATDRPIGVLQNKPKSASEAAEVAPLVGRLSIVSDGTTPIAAGDYVGPDASGRVIKKTTADNVIIGIALEASSAAGVVIAVLCIPLGFFRTAA